MGALPASDAADGPTVLFGLGATKAGTTWLYRYLAGHPECHFRTVKELHFFDHDRAPEYQLRVLRDKRVKLSADRDAALPQGGTQWRRLDQRLRDVEELIAVQESRDRGAYMAYLAGGAEGRRLIGDITPAYALVPPETLVEMAGLSARSRFIYLMRDPVARLWSNVRMKAARKLTGLGEGLREAVDGMFEAFLRGKHEDIAVRGDYRAALERFDRGIPAERLLVLFYEDLFSGATLERICGFLGLRPHEGQTDTRVHEGVHVEMRPAQRQEALALLRPQYDYVAARMGRLPGAWAASLAGEAA